MGWREQRVARELRRLRGNRPGREIQQWAGITLAKLSRLESGSTRAKPADIRLLCAVYGADAATVEQLVGWAAAAREPQWWQPWVDPQRDMSLMAYLESETEARRVDLWHPAEIPHLVRTDAYARAVLAGSYGVRPEDVQRRVELAAARRARVERGELDVWLIVSEGALHREVGGPVILAEQLRYLASLTAVTVQVVPFTAGAHPGLGHSAFQLLWFASRMRGFWEDTVLDGIYSDEESVLEEVETLVRGLQATAASPTESRHMLLERAEALSPAAGAPS